MKQRTLLATAICAALMLPICTTLAQDATPTQVPTEAKAKSLETVTVTGSRIRSVDLETAQPIFSLSRQEIQKQGYTSTADIISRLTTAAGSSSYSRSASLTSNTYAGSSTIELRGIGAARTLVLVDGRRWGTNADGFTDLDTIPSSIIERIDVLKDGASAIYGSDAIAGVINIITRSNFKGAEANAYYGQFGKGDGARQQYDFTWGNKIGKLSYVFSGTYAKDDPVWARNRSFSATPNGPYHPTAGLSAFGPGGLITNAPGGSYKLNSGGDPTKFADYRAYNPSTDNYNYTQQMMLVNGAKRKSLFGKVNYAITDNVSFRADAAYTERTSNVQIAGYPLGTGNTGAQLDKDSYYNPLGSQQGYANPQDVSFLRRGVEQPRVTKNTLKTYRVGAGFEGVFQVGERNFNWDTTAFFNKNKGNVFGIGDYNVLNLAQGLGPSFMGSDGVVRCGRPGAVISGCTPVNILSGEGGLTPAMRNYIGQSTSTRYGTQTTGFSANIGGDVVQLPAGMMQFAAGAEYRRESGYTNPDAFSQTGNSTNLATASSSGKYNTKEVYAELNIPVLADLPFAKLLSVDLASRFSRYSTFGDTTNSKFGLQWKPINDLLVRGSISQGFRSPTINDLYGGTSQTFDTYTDPCDSKYGAVATGNANAIANCRAAGLNPSTLRQLDASGNPTNAAATQSTTPFLAGANDKLKAETSLNKTLGLVYSPSYVDGLNVSLDWYNIRIKNQITSVSSNDVLNDCYLRNLTASCRLFSRDAQGQVVNLSHTLANRGTLQTEGYDFNIAYRLPDTAIGKFQVRLDNNYVVKYNESLGSGVTQYNAGQYSYWRIRSNANLDWSYGDFGATWGVRYYSGLKEDCAFDVTGGTDCGLPNYVSPGQGITPKRQVGAIAFNDLQLRWSAPWNATISVGANNVFDRQSPLFYSASGNAGSSNSAFVGNPAYDIGRFWYVRYNQRF